MMSTIIESFLEADDYYITVSSIVLLLILIGIYRISKPQQRVDGLGKPLPSPRGLPILGFLPYVGEKPPETFAKLAKELGPIFKVQMGSLPCLVLNSFEAVKEAFVKQSENYSGRPNEVLFKIYDDEPAFIFDDGPTFKELRFFTMDALKKLGFGRLSLEPLVKDEVQYLIREFSKYKSKPFNPASLINTSVGNAVCSIMNGKRLDYDDPWLVELFKAIDNLRKTYVHDYAFYFPILKKLPVINLFTSEKQKRYWKQEIWRLWREKVTEVQRETEAGLILDNFISCWNKERDKKVANADPHANMYSELNLVNNLEIFAQAAFETTSSTIMWAFMCFIKHPETQTKIINEINSLGEEQRANLSFTDAKYLPYTRAFIQEIHRLSSISPLGVFHRTCEPTILMDYYVPKNILTIANAYAIHYNEDYFPEAKEFKPERFLNENGEYVRDERVIAFSIGKRFCPGEFVAQMELFHYITQIVCNFELKLDGDHHQTLGECDENASIRHPKPFKIHFIPRDTCTVK